MVTRDYSIFTCKIHYFSGHFDPFPNGEVRANPAKEQCAEQGPNHGAHVMDTGRDLQYVVAKIKIKM